MLKNEIIAMVQEFQDYFDTDESTKSVAFRNSLIEEETNELLNATNIVDQADAYGDIAYVIAGSVIKFSDNKAIREQYEFLLDKHLSEFSVFFTSSEMPQIMKEIHRSNMSKACNSLEEAHLTIAKYNYVDDFRVLVKNGKYLIYCNANYNEIKKGKLLKGINYSPANLSPLLHANPKS